MSQMQMMVTPNPKMTASVYNVSSVTLFIVHRLRNSGPKRSPRTSKLIVQLKNTTVMAVFQTANVVDQLLMYSTIAKTTSKAIMASRPSIAHGHKSGFNIGMG